MYASEDASSPWYSCPHLSLTLTDLPVRSARNGLGFTIRWLCVMIWCRYKVCV